LYVSAGLLLTALLFDGDRIACLSAMLLKDLISQLPPAAQDVSVGIIQTAYANGAASRYIRDNLGCSVEVGCGGGRMPG
jgi:phosphoacetylglucosamine mutase